MKKSEIQNANRKGAGKGKRTQKEKKAPEEYIPYRSEDKKKRKSRQSLYRNILPNILHQIFSFINKKNKSLKCVQKINSSFPTEQEIEVDRFYLYQKLVKEKTNRYINENALLLLNQIQDAGCEQYGLGEQATFLKINRMLTLYFLEQEYDAAILTSSRLRNADSRTNHLKIKRHLREKVKSIWRAGEEVQ